MRTYSLSVGLVIRRGDRTRRLERHLEDGQLVFVDQVTGTPHTMTPGALQRLVFAGDLEIVSGDPASVASTGVSAPLVKTLDDLPEHQAKEVRRRYRYVIYMKRKGLRRGMHARIAHALAGLNGKVPRGEAKVLCENDPHPPCASTVMEWMKRWETSGGNLMSLLTRHAVRVTPKRLDPRVLAIGRAKVRTFYCTKRRPTINDTQEEVEKELKAKSLDTETISISTIRRLIEEICPYERDVARFGGAYARHKWRYSLKGIGADRPMQRYEIDHTVLDVVVICDRTGMPLGRPTITIVVDAFSGLVAGIFISFWGTGLAATLSALKVAISPKDEYVTRNSLAANWLPYGIPGLMVVDNGLEFHSPQFHDIAMYLNMDLRFCAVRQPWLFKATKRSVLAREIHARMVALDPKAAECRPGRVYYWLALQDKDDTRPHASKDSKFFKVFCQTRLRPQSESVSVDRSAKVQDPANKVQKSKNFDRRCVMQAGRRCDFAKSCVELHASFAYSRVPLCNARGPLPGRRMRLFRFCMTHPITVVTA